jgi:hypothetical protein
MADTSTRTGAFRSRRRIIVWAALVAAVALLAVAAVRWLLPEAERVEDDAAGLSYELPAGWEELPDYDRAERFTSAADAGLLGPFVGGFGEEIAPGGDLGALAESMAVELPRDMLSASTAFTVLRSESVDIGGRAAHEIELTAADPVHGGAYVRLLVVAVDAGRAGVLYGFDYLDLDDARGEIGDVFASVELC